MGMHTCLVVRHQDPEDPPQPQLRLRIVREQTAERADADADGDGDGADTERAKDAQERVRLWRARVALAHEREGADLHDLYPAGLHGGDALLALDPNCARRERRRWDALRTRCGVRRPRVSMVRAW